MRVLLGTTNPSKVGYFAKVLEGTEISFVTLRDLCVDAEPEETGASPQENAAIKARFYAQYAPDGVVICADSGLYLDELPLDDPRQPGLHIRTPQGGKRLDDDEMIAYYAQLVHSLGGKVRAYYMDAMALSIGGQLHDFVATREEVQDWAFDMVDVPCVWRREGWPLDSLSLEKDGRYFLDPAGHRSVLPQEKSGYWPRLRRFLQEKLG